MKEDHPCAVRRQVKDMFWRVFEVYNFLSALLKHMNSKWDLFYFSVYKGYISDLKLHKSILQN